jgi:hypothetical protein
MKAYGLKSLPDVAQPFDIHTVKLGEVDVHFYRQEFMESLFGVEYGCNLLLVDLSRFRFFHQLLGESKVARETY